MAMGWQIFRVMFFLVPFVDRSLGIYYSPLRFVIEQSLPQNVHSGLGLQKWIDLEILHPTCQISPSIHLQDTSIPFVFVEMVWGCDSGVIY